MLGTPPIRTIQKSYKNVHHKRNIDILRAQYIVFCRNYLIKLFKYKITNEKELNIIGNIKRYLILFIKHCDNNVHISNKNYEKINTTLTYLKNKIL
jgi:hypothetical protein